MPKAFNNVSARDIENNYIYINKLVIVKEE